MRIGLTVSDPDTVVSEARAAEELGFDLLGCGEHLFFHGPTPNGFTMLAAAAAVTSRIRLVSSITLLPLYPPALVAKMATTLDRISDGRFELGVGSGGEYPPEFAAVGVDPVSRFRRTDEGLAVLRQLFAGGPVSFEGEYSRLQGVRLDPSPRQPGGPPIWLGGRKGRALRRVGRFADVWLPYMIEPRHVASGLKSARAHAVDAGRRGEDVSAALFVWSAADADRAWARETAIQTVSTAYQQDFTDLADRYLIVGEPESVVARLLEFGGAGVDSALLQIAAGDPGARQRIIETLAREVIPAVRAADADNIDTVRSNMAGSRNAQ